MRGDLQVYINGNNIYVFFVWLFVDTAEFSCVSIARATNYLTLVRLICVARYNFSLSLLLFLSRSLFTFFKPSIISGGHRRSSFTYTYGRQIYKNCCIVQNSSGLLASPPVFVPTGSFFVFYCIPQSLSSFLCPSTYVCVTARTVQRPSSSPQVYLPGNSFPDCFIHHAAPSSYPSSLQECRRPVILIIITR